jgi:hypothetical protein
MEHIKNIAAALGAVLSLGSVLALCSKPLRAGLARLVGKYSRTDETHSMILEIKETLHRHVADDNSFRESMAAFAEHMNEISEITLDFTKSQCKNIIKNIFHRYKGEKRLPLYEKKALLNVGDLFVNKLRCKSYAVLMLREMESWEVDYDSDAQLGDEDDD